MARNKKEDIDYSMPEAEGHGRASYENITPQQYVANYKDYLSRYIAKMNPSKDTLVTYYSAIDQFLTWCLENGLEPLDLGDYQGRIFVEWLKKKRHYEKSTMANKVIAVRNFYAAAIRLGFLEINPFEDISVSGASEPRINFFTTEEIEKLVEAFEQKRSHFQSARDLAMLYLMGVEGLRNVEVHRMDREDIDWDNGIIQIHGKGHDRQIYPCGETMKRLERYMAVCIKPKETSPTPLFLSDSRAWYGQRISRNGIRYVMNAAEKIVGLKKPGESCHILRHSVGTNLYAATKDLRLVQDTLGHRDPKITARYAHLSERMENRLTESIAPRADKV